MSWNRRNAGGGWGGPSWSLRCRHLGLQRVPGLRGAGGGGGGSTSRPIPLPVRVTCANCATWGLAAERALPGLGSAPVPGHGGGRPGASSAPAGVSSLRRSPSLLFLEEPEEEGAPAAGPPSCPGRSLPLPLSRIPQQDPAGLPRQRTPTFLPLSRSEAAGPRHGRHRSCPAAGTLLPCRGVKKGGKKKSSQELKQNLKPKSATKPGSPALGRSSRGVAVGPGAHGSPGARRSITSRPPGPGGKLRQRQQRCTQINI